MAEGGGERKGGREDLVGKEKRVVNELYVR